MSPPTLSVVLLNYNHGKFLRQCLAGLLSQTYADFEIVLVDDGSTDNSREIIHEHMAADSRIKLTAFPVNRGIKAGLREGLSHATGRYFYSAAADDFVVNKEFFHRAVRVLAEDPRPAGYYGVAGIYVAETEKLAGAMGTAETEGYNTPLQCCVGLLKYRSIVTGPSCIVRRDLFMQWGGNEIEVLMDQLGPQMDYFLNHSLAWRYGMYFEKQPFACQRIFQARTNYSANLDIFAYAARLAEMEKRLRTIDITYPDIEKDWMRWRALNLLDAIKKSGVRL